MSTAKTHKPLSLKEKIAYGSGDFACNLHYAPISSLLPMYYTGIVGIQPGLFSSMIAISNLLDAGSDVIMGFVIDRTKSPLGKARPWIMRMCIPFAICSVLLFSVPSSLDITGSLIWLFITYNLARTIFSTSVNIPYSSLLSYITDDEAERGILGNIRMVFAFSAQLVISFLALRLVVFFGGDIAVRSGWTKAFSIFGILSVIFYLFCAGNLTEKHSVTEVRRFPSMRDTLHYLSHNRNWIVVSLCMVLFHMSSNISQSSAAYYAQYLLNDVQLFSWLNGSLQFSGLFCLLVILPLLLRKFSKYRIFLTGTVFMILGALFTAIFSKTIYGICAGNVLKGIGTSMIGAMAFGLLADSLTAPGTDRGFIGIGTAAYSFLLKIGNSIGAVIWGQAMSFGGFASSATVQSASALAMIRMTYLFVTLGGSFMILLIALLYRTRGKNIQK
ncbi:MAG: MFS transporter [Solobacterium sp.]|nr:MFS transporter [Solobacterium sp.]